MWTSTNNITKRKSKLKSRLLGLLDHIVLFVMEEDQGEDEDSSHHAEGGGVVGVSLPNEPLVLVVAERDHRDLKVGDLSKTNS